MASIVYKSLSSLSPIELKYQYYRDEDLQTDSVTYQDGLTFYGIKGLKNFQDIAINRDTVLVLTSAVNLADVFVPTQEVSLGNLPGSFQLQPRNTNIYYVKYRADNNSFVQTLSSATTFYIQPISNSLDVELFVENKYVQVEAAYPYKVYLNERSLDLDEIHRQRFQIVYDGGFLSIKTKTNQGYRYLAFNNDNILRAVGVILNNTAVNDYIFKCIPITRLSLNRGFTPANDWVTYYFDIEQETENKTVTINKTFTSIPTNLLLNFSLNRGAESGIANINVANLKTTLTPAGGPAPLENAYTKTVITKN